MAIVIFSDTHLTEKFDSAKCSFLKKYIALADRVIINGDFWDYYETTFAKFVNSKWAVELFPLLKAKQSVYIYGNRDQKKWQDESNSLFSSQQVKRFKLVENGTTFFIEHGHLLKKKTFAGRDKYMSLLKFFRVSLFMKVLEYLQIKFLGLKAFKKNNAQYLPIVRQLNPGEWLIVGDTHCADLDYNLHFANTGFIKFGYASLIIIENDGTVRLVEERY